MKQYLETKPKMDRIIVPSDTTKQSLLFDDIVFIRSDGGYSIFHTLDRGHIITSRSIKFYEQILPENIFFRTHKSFIVNYNHIKALPSGRSGQIIMTQDKMADLSVRRAPDFRDWYKKLSFRGGTYPDND